MTKHHNFAALFAAAMTISPIPVQAAGGYFEVEPGVDIYYEDHGAGKPLVLVPGWTFTTEVFENQIPAFSQKHRVITFDPRSHGRSTDTLEGNNYVTQGADLVRLLEHLEVKNPVLVGWSFGCLTTWEFIRTQSTSAAAAHMCIDLPPTPMTGQAEDWVEGSIPDISSLYHGVQSASGHRDVVNWYADEIMIEQDYTPELSKWIIDQSTSSPPWAAAAYWAAGNFSDYMDTAKQIDRELPSAFVVASHWADKAKPYLAKHTPNSAVHVFGGHMMFWEYPDRFNEVLAGLIAQAE
ncbi:pimeloyl-ACP methyl ester carboxylesterase [Roseibium hamelinense]|uniref:Pimeloyl-ACP methyl ester carboxylesterase n=1 Tax=Roseibium hamelinense TaxID=150831 RepID=A0A562SFK7_9HYPH|nr:alpha/beta hydrolase [Roseibium hamelinense]MTI44159.1 alpha/beta hydrolase [Roseibium hamelinense]TWI80058.1 pimeloyl-ACP methyl ester carboxylesterase [Roseibium hamelinense]